LNSETKRIYVCNACGHEGKWGDGWSCYGSILHMEICPDDLPVACSAECASVIDNKVKSGEFVLPRLRMSMGGYCFDMVSERKGY